MKLSNLKKTVIGSILSSFVLFGAVGLASAQDYNDQYRQWQQAQRRAQMEYQNYLRSRDPSDYRDWQRAQQRAQQEYLDYRRSTGFNNGYSNNGYSNSNNGYSNNGYSNQSGGTRWYRVYRNGSYYQTDSRGAELLRQAVNSGYKQGYRQGQQDARYGRNGSYYGNNMYSSGTYGYQSYVDRSQYQYYFQQGFQRGYEDGLNNQNHYGYRSNNGINILGTILNGILNISRQ